MISGDRKPKKLACLFVWCARKTHIVDWLQRHSSPDRFVLNLWMGATVDVEIGGMNPKKFVTPTAASLIAIGIVSVSPQAHGTSALDACSLLTATQVGAALGMTVNAGNATGANVCTWGKGSKRVRLTLHPPRDFETFKLLVGAGVTKVAVAGVGDGAVSGTSRYDTQLSVKKGMVVFVITVSGFPDDQIKSLEKTLALNAVAKL